MFGGAHASAQVSYSVALNSGGVKISTPLIVKNDDQFAMTQVSSRGSGIAVQMA